MPNSDSGKGTYAGLFLVALSTLLFELLPMRIFSVTLWYHLAFMVVSIAMFGMTVGAVIVYLRPGWFGPARGRGGRCAGGRSWRCGSWG